MGFEVAKGGTAGEWRVEDLLDFDDGDLVAEFSALVGKADAEARSDKRILRRIDNLSQSHGFALASASSTPDWVLERLASSQDMRLLRRLLTNPTLSEAALYEMTSTDEGAKLVAEHPGASEIVLAAVVQSDEERAASAIVAANPTISVEIQHRLINSSSWYVRAALAANPATKTELIESLAQDGVWAVRHNAASSPNLSSAAAEKLSLDIAAVRLQLAGNAAATQTHNHLSIDEDEWVYRTALRYCSDVATLREHGESMEAPAWVLKRIAANPNCPQDLADQLGAWLVLGGGSGDAEFDPVACVGHPGEETESKAEVFRFLAGDLPIRDPHPLARVRKFQEIDVPLRGRKALAALEDPDGHVRHARAARVTQLATAHIDRISRSDPFGNVAMALTRRKQDVRIGAWISAAAVGCLVAGLGILSAMTDDPNDFDYDSFDFATLSSFQTLPSYPNISDSSGVALREETVMSQDVELKVTTVLDGHYQLTVSASGQPVEVTGISFTSVSPSARPSLLVEPRRATLAAQLPVLVQPYSMAEFSFQNFAYGTTAAVELIVEGEKRTVEVRLPDILDIFRDVPSTSKSTLPSTTPSATTR